MGRAATTALLVILGGAYRDWCEIFAFLAALDIFSHWMHTTSCMMSNQHHKAAQVLERRSALLRFYYTNKLFMGLCCTGAELFYVTILMLSYDPGHQIAIFYLETFAWRFCFPLCVLKNVININQLAAATWAICEADVADQND